MLMMSKELKEAFAKQGDTEGKPADQVMVLAHYFTSSWDWWATEFDPVSRNFFGLVRGFETELGSFSLDELEKNSSNVKPFGIDRDLYWEPKPLAEVLKNAAKR
jgi:hypothetical protein